MIRLAKECRGMAIITQTMPALIIKTTTTAHHHHITYQFHKVNFIYQLVKINKKNKNKTKDHQHYHQEQCYIVIQ